MLKWGFFGVFQKMERQQRVFLRRSLKYFLWFCFEIVSVLFAKKGFLLGGNNFSNSLLIPFFILIHHAFKGFNDFIFGRKNLVR